MVRVGDVEKAWLNGEITTNAVQEFFKMRKCSRVMDIALVLYNTTGYKWKKCLKLAEEKISQNCAENMLDL